MSVTKMHSASYSFLKKLCITTTLYTFVFRFFPNFFRISMNVFQSYHRCLDGFVSFQFYQLILLCQKIHDYAFTSIFTSVIEIKRQKVGPGRECNKISFPHPSPSIAGDYVLHRQAYLAYNSNCVRMLCILQFIVKT